LKPESEVKPEKNQIELPGRRPRDAENADGGSNPLEISYIIFEAGQENNILLACPPARFMD